MDRYIYLALVAALPIIRPFPFAIGGYDIVLADTLFVLLAAALAIRVVTGRLRIVWTPWHTAGAAFAVAGFISAAVAADQQRGLVKAAASAYLVALGILTSHYARERQMRRQILLAWVAGLVITIVAAVAGIVLFAAGDRSNQFLYGYGSLIPGAYPRVMALFANSNMLCSYLGAGVMFVLAAERSGDLPPSIARPLAIAIVVITAFTFSPGIGGIALCLALWYAASIAAWSPVAAAATRAAGAIAVVVFTAATVVSPTMLQRDAVRQFEPSSRVLTWIDAARTFIEHPVFGAGPGADVANVRYLNASQLLEHLTDAHNMWLSVLAQTGGVGFLCFAALIGMLLVRMRTRIDLTREGAWRTGCELALIAAVLYPSLSGSFEDTRHVWVVLGLVHAAQAGATDARTDRETRSR